MSATAFLTWWRDHLLDWIPPRLRQAAARNTDALLLRPHDDDWELIHQHNGRRIPLGDDQLVPRVPRVQVTLPPEYYLARTVDLPVAAAADLQQAIAFQIEALTPFTRDDVWLFCGEQQRLSDGKRLRAWLVAVPKRWRHALTALGLTLEDAPIAGPRALPPQEGDITLTFRPGSQGSRVPLGWVLIGLNLAALVLAVSLHLDNREKTLEALKAQIKEQQDDALAAADLQRRADVLQQRLTELQQRRSAHVPRVALLDEVTRRLDDHTWVHRFELRDNKLRLQGSSSNASALIGELDASPLIGDVRFEASLTRDPSGGERFNLAGTVSPVTPDATVAEVVR